MKYKGTYRLMANLDHDTNDFPRDDKGNLDTDDIYIKCHMVIKYITMAEMIL